MEIKNTPLKLKLIRRIKPLMWTYRFYSTLLKEPSRSRRWDLGAPAAVGRGLMGHDFRSASGLFGVNPSPRGPTGGSQWGITPAVALTATLTKKDVRQS